MPVESSGSQATHSATSSPGAPASVAVSTRERRWQVLAVLSLVQFMLLLDDTIVNIALPSIREDLEFSQTG